MTANVMCGSNAPRGNGALRPGLSPGFGQMTYGALLDKSLKITAMVCYSGDEWRGSMGAVPPVSLLEGVRDRSRVKYYSVRTE